MVEQQQSQHQQQRQKEEKEEPEPKKVIDFSKSKEEQQQKEKIKEDTDFPPFETQKITVRREYRNDRFGNSYGPYIYCYWKDKQTHKLKKYYVGKSVEDHDSRAAYKSLDVKFGLNDVMSGMPRRPSEWRKWEFLMSQKFEKQNKLAEFYLKKVEDNEVTIDWAYRLVKRSIHEIRTNTLLAMAAKENITHNTVENQYFGAQASTTDNDVITHFLYQKHIYRNKQVDEYLESDEVKQEYVTQTWSLWNKYTHTIKIEEEA